MGTASPLFAHTTPFEHIALRVVEENNGRRGQASSNNLSGSSVLISKYEGSFALIRVKSDINIKLIKFPVQGRKMRANNTWIEQENKPTILSR